MSSNRLLVLVIAIALGIGVAFVGREGIATKANASSANQPYNDFAQRHPDLRIAVTGSQPDYSGSDYFERHLAQLSMAARADTTDYSVRHPELNQPLVRQVDLTDYYFRHPELGAR